MKIRSEVVEGIEFDVTLYDTENGKKGITHESLEDIIYNRVPKELNVKCEIHVLAVTPTYCAVKCEISDSNGRKVYGFNDTNLEHLEKDDDFTKQHPLIKSVQSAMDVAIKTYFKWPRMFQGTAYATEVSGNEGIVLPDESEHVNPEAETENEFSGMNPPEEPEANTADKPNTKNESNKAAGEDFSGYSMEELGSMTVKTGTYKDKTLDEMWETMPSWFDFVLNKSQSPKYDNAREYARRKAAE